MKTYKLVNNLTGWLVFAIAAWTYCSTIEPTASFWDCPEFITTAAKLEVGHPPGAPFFMLFGNFFAQFASDPSQIARMINMMNALLSAGCILLLFWSITHLVLKLFMNDNQEQPTLSQTIAIMASGICGALIYTWSDTFWFSAVEGEVYAFSSFFTALVFWLILKWEDNADKPSSDRWLVFIAYLVGLSIGVHLLNLLCIPAIVLVYYYKMAKNPTGTGSLLVLALSAVIVAAVLYGIVPGIVKVGGWFELLFVNQLGFSYNTGLFIYLALLTASLIWGLVESTKVANLKAENKPVSNTLMNVSFIVSTGLLGIPFVGHGAMSVVLGIVILGALAALLFLRNDIKARILNTTLLCMMVMVIGYASYAVIVVRSTANPPMDQNSPEDIFTLGEYLSREQYGDRPLLWGQTFNSEPAVVSNGQGQLVYDTSKGATIYQRIDKADPSEPDKYREVREKMSLVYPTDQSMIFPRIYDDAHKGDYESWLGNIHYKTVNYVIPGVSTRQIQIPSQVDNISFFLSYQMNWMYWRYFMWNFAGRQNDIQGHGNAEHGNWLTGLDFLDEARLGVDFSALPTELKENKGHNVFYCMPLILGIIGLMWQAFRDKKGIQQFWVVFFLFFMTGIAIVIYLNQTPSQPRERDYAYAGSFYAFSIWCGMGIAAIYEWLNKALGNKASLSIVASLISLVPAVAVPLQMVSQTWDDHDRSDRYVCRDFGLNYLETVPKNGIIFTNGDNDTFPLWYNEDTEEKRRDVRVCNLSYLQTDWYIDQMKRPAFSGEQQSEALPIDWNRLQYTSGTNEMIDVNPVVGQMGGSEITVKDIVRMIQKENPEEAKAMWGDNPFELHKAIHTFILRDNIPAQYAAIMKDIPVCLPSDSLVVTVDKEAVRRSGMMIPQSADSTADNIPDEMVISLSGQKRISKSFCMMLEMISNGNFSRPIYMSTTVGQSNYGTLYRHFIQEGIAWRISPFTFAENKPMQTVVDVDKMYDNMMNKYSYGNLSQPGLYIDETTMRMCYTHRRWFANLISNLVQRGDIERAKKALEKCEKEIPSYNVPYNASSGAIDLSAAQFACGNVERAVEIMKMICVNAEEYMKWYLAQSDSRFRMNTQECYQQLSIMMAAQHQYENFAKRQEEKGGASKVLNDEMARSNKAFENYYDLFAARCERLGISME